MPGEVGVLLSPQDCENILSKFDENATLAKYEINRISGKVFGFLAAHYYVTIEYTRNGQNVVYSHRFFLKTMPTANETQRAYIESMGIFKKEILNYKNFLSEFSQLTKVPFVAKYYFSKSDCLVIEDLSSLNYQVCNMEYLGHRKCVGALNALARLHASSIIFEEARSTKEQPYRLNEHFHEELTEATFSFQEGHVRNKWCKTSTRCLEQLSRYFTNNEEVARKIKQYVFSENGLKKYIRPSRTYRNTVCHDDLWCNNMMFNERDECMLLDFQLSRYTPPVFDVLLLLHLGTTASYLNKNIEYLLDLYYNFLTNELSRYDLKIEEIISKDDFLASAEEYTLPALVEAGLYGTNVYLPESVSSIVVSCPENFLEFAMKDRPSFVVKEFERNQEYRERFSTVLKPLFHIIEEIEIN
ncbi:uncharacterized protein LOC108909668 [Anoplophora glabripennis]|uniref:uncharacterized protein LOC108909668 n=1 Tax=Anoplophora glabripennis TaxID=217634 RepID=UPI00087444A2|nr:uncharacterized protein LOC108909668 [Anoplophora glabripennis]